MRPACVTCRLFWLTYSGPRGCVDDDDKDADDGCDCGASADAVVWLDWLEAKFEHTRGW